MLKRADIVDRNGAILATNLMTFSLFAHPKHITQPAMVAIHGPGRWFDADQLLIGAGCLTPDEERTQMALWSVLAQPLFVSADFRNMSADSAAVLLNERAIAIDQDPLGSAGDRLSNSTNGAQGWAKQLGNGDQAVVLYNAHNFNTGAVNVTWDMVWGDSWEGV